MGNLLRRYEIGPNSPDFSLRRINYAPQNRENLFSLSYLTRYDNHHPATSWRITNE
jgi:hypothetical protein